MGPVGPIEFDVTGIPIAQPRPRVVMSKGRVHAYSHPGDHPVSAWRSSITAECMRVCLGKTYFTKNIPICVTLSFRFPGGEIGEYHTCRPDIDNLAKAVLDALNDSRLWADDSQVSMLCVVKRRCRDEERPGVHIMVRDLSQTFDIPQNDTQPTGGVTQ